MFEVIFSIFTILVVMGIFIFYFFFKKKGTKDWFYAFYFVLILGIGAILYLRAIIYGGYEGSIILLFGQAFMGSIRSFTGYLNSYDLAPLAESRPLFAIAAFLHYIAAVCLTFLVAVQVFGKNLLNRISVFFNSFRQKSIIIGATDQAEIFLGNFNQKSKKRVTVILETPDLKSMLIFQGFRVVVIRNDDIEAALVTAGLNRPKRLTRIISMSEDDEINLQVARVVAASPNQNLTAHIMYKNLERAEHFTFAQAAHGRVRFFNPYEVRARKFMRYNPITKLIPSDWINTTKARLKTEDENGLSRPYSIAHLFVGFGPANRQLMKQAICNYQLLGVDFNAIVFDQEATKLGEQFRNRVENMEHNPQIFLPCPAEHLSINFLQKDCLGADFYKTLTQHVAKLDFATVFISLGDDKLAAETALEIRSKLYAKNLHNRVKIFVKLSKRNSALAKICENIQTFGIPHEVLTKKYIIDAQLDIEAKRIAAIYGTPWEELSEFKRDSNRYAALSTQAKLNLLGFDQVTKENFEDFSKAYDLGTSLRLRKIREEDKKFVDLFTGEDTARNNLARLEHQRWNAMHLANGWGQLEKSKIDGITRQDPDAKKHACITTLEGLVELRQIQATALLKNKVVKTMDEALLQVDTMHIDFQGMDFLKGAL
ncbi:MAG: hypothetical protein FWE31_03180 [Firmicutes bacterium]|nr:hypothetical protein [Bacillota bacterium]